MKTWFWTSRQRPGRSRRRRAAVLCAALTLFWTGSASAQLDPLLFVKRVPPTVIIVVDTSMRMMEDGSGNYYDPNEYTVSHDVTVANRLGVGSAARYRRIYANLQYENVQDSNAKFEATNITAVANTANGYAGFYSRTRLEIAKSGIDRALTENSSSMYRWGLVKLRQSSPAWRVSPNCDKPVRVTANADLATIRDSSPCNVGTDGRFGIYVPSVGRENFLLADPVAGGARLVPASAPSSSNFSASAVLGIVRKPLNDNTGLIPAGGGTRAYGDRPLKFALDDARALAIAAMDADSDAARTCRNTVVVLITGGKNEGSDSYLAAHDAAAAAASFLKVSSKGTTKRVPIHVLAVAPEAGHEPELQAIAANSGGRFVNVSSPADVASAINYALQQGFARSTEFDAGKPSEFLPVSPIVGTVNLKAARDAKNATLPNTDILSKTGNQALPQRSNFMLTAGFSLPGFDGVLRAFRVYKPAEDKTKPTGWKFVNDGTALWPDLDGRPWLAGLARVPKDPGVRNVYTYIPNGSGGGSVVAFNAANEGLLRPHMNAGSSVGALIEFVRRQPIGAVIGSTPAIMDVPSLDPPPDSDYGFADAAGTFAATYKHRRALIFFGGNNGMIHAVDARTGYELWAFVPYNLLPKLRTLADGQPVEQFDYFVDSSPKIAEVKLNGEWRSLLLIGQGPGGTFYQAFDVTEAGMGVAPELDDIGAVDALLARFDSPDESIQFKWAFPNYSSFDPTFTASSAECPEIRLNCLPSLGVVDATPGGKVKLFGDLKASASQAEKTVGFTWSDPAVGPLDPNRSTNAVIVGSGYFPDIEGLVPSRGLAAPKAGSTFYLLDAGTGLLLGGVTSCTSVSSGSGSGTGCVSIGDLTTNTRKNAIQADPTAAGEASSIVVSKAYVGDVDGRYWRFKFNGSGTISATQMVNTGQPIYSSSALLFIGTAQVYMFFATGSDLLPADLGAGGTGTFKLYGLKDNAPGDGATVMFAQNLAATTSVSGLASGERPSTSPSVAGDIVFFTTTVESAGDPCADFNGRLYAFTYAGGAAYDTNDNGKIDTTESPIVKTMAGRATAPFIVDQHLYVGTSGATGASIEAFGDPEDFNNGVGQVGVRILSWREIR